MTIILGFPAADGVVLASDSQVTKGDVRFKDTKIFQLYKNIIWGAAGNVALIQAVKLKMRDYADPESLGSLDDLCRDLAKHIKKSTEELLDLDFRTTYLPQDRPALALNYYAEFLFGEHSKEGSGLLKITSYGSPEWIKQRPEALGNGSTFAYALLQKYQGLKLDVERACVLAYKTIEEAIAVGAYGLGPPIDIWVVDDCGTRRLDKDTDIPALEDTVKGIREKELESFRPRSPSPAKD